MDYQAKYNTLKRRLKVLLYEQESFQKELEKSQVKLIRVSRDKTFLLDRLLLYEHVSGDSSNDSDATLSSDNEVEVAPKRRSVNPDVSNPPNMKIENEDYVDHAAVKMEVKDGEETEISVTAKGSQTLTEVKQEASGDHPVTAALFESCIPEPSSSLAESSGHT